MAVSAHDVARELRNRQSIPRTRLQKLLYYCQGWHLALYGEPLYEEDLEAWTNGPVVASVWRSEHHGDPVPPPRELPESGSYVLDLVLGRYGAINGPDMVNQTHDEMPWRLAWERGRNTPLDREVLRGYFANEPETAATLSVMRTLARDEGARGLIGKAMEEDAMERPKPADSREAIDAYRRQLLGSQS